VAKQMKILLVEPFGHQEGHFSVYARYLSQALAEADSDVTLLTFDGLLGNGIDDRVKHFPLLTEAKAFARMWRPLRRFLHFILPLRPFIGPLQTILALGLALRQNKKQRYDVIHLLDTSTVSFLFIVFASIVKNCNLVLTLHGVPREYYLKDWRKEVTASLKSRDCLRCLWLLQAKVAGAGLTARLERFLYHRAVKRNHIAFVCYTEETQQTYAHSVFYDKVAYVPDSRPKPPVLTQQEARQYLGLPLGERILLSFGINHDMKDYKVIFQAAQNLPMDFKLLFAGKIIPDGAKQNDPRRLAEEYGLAEKTIIVDKYIPEEDMPHYFYAADALIVSYRKGFQQLSGNLLQACQCNLPAIGINAGHLGEFISRHNLGLTFTPEDPRSLRQVFLTFLNMSDEERQAMRKHVSEYAATSHSWEQMTKGYLGLYQSLLEKTNECEKRA